MGGPYTIEQVRKVIMTVTDEMIEQKALLTEIDGKLGDGDMGISMEKAALAIRQVLDDTDESNPGKLLVQCAMACNRAAPSTMGTLLSIGIMSVGKAAMDREVLEESFVVKIPSMMAAAISMRGKAQEGDKTILDALYPFARTLEETYAATGSLKIAVDSAAEASELGAEETKGRVAKIGRARWLAERNKEYPDGGAILCARIARRLTIIQCN